MCNRPAKHVITPTAINVLKAGGFLFVSAYDSTATPNRGYVFTFAVGSGGALTPVNGGVPHDMGIGVPGFGIHPTAIASDSTSTYVYVTDSTNNIVASYSIASGTLALIATPPLEISPAPLSSIQLTRSPMWPTRSTPPSRPTP